jgi:phage terminase small subunit
MPPLDNPQHERFAIHIVKGLSQSEAYTKAGFKSSKANVRQNASRLMRDDAVRLRVRELQEKQAKRLNVDVDLLVSELNDMLKLAAKVKHPAAGVGAILGKAKLLGLIVEKAEIETTARRPLREPSEVKKLSLDEWQKKFAPKHLLDPLPVDSAEPPANDDDKGGDSE